MTDDPIVDEVRAEREKYAASFNYDIRAMVADLRKQEQQENRKTIRRAPRRPDRRFESTKKAG